MYYAHLERYEDGLQAGDVVAKGQVIGYLGDSGYGPEGTTGEFEPHLHFGIYQPVEKAFSPIRSSSGGRQGEGGIARARSGGRIS